MRDRGYNKARLEQAVDIGANLAETIGEFDMALRNIQELQKRGLNEIRKRLAEKAYLFPSVADSTREAFWLAVIPPFGSVVYGETR